MECKVIQLYMKLIDAKLKEDADSTIFSKYQLT